MSNHDVPNTTDVLIIGGGPGGYVAALRAGQLDLDVTLVEKDHLGGACLNFGCVPSKALITASSLTYDATNAESMGIHADVTVDLEEMVDWKHNIVNELTRGVEQLCKANGVTVVDGIGTFDGEHRANVVTDGHEYDIEFGHAIVATGSRPIEIPGFAFEDEHVLSSRDALSLDEVPNSLVVVGAGYIGMELATVYAKLGTDVTVVEMLDQVLPGFETDLTRPVKKQARGLGIEFNFGEAAQRWHERSDHIEVITATEDGEEHTHAADKVLVAVGREPVTETVNPNTIGLKTDDRGFLNTDDRCRTDIDHVFAVGDVAGEPMLAHKGSKEGEVSVEVIAGEPARVDYMAVPAAVFTEPEIGTVGLSPSEASERGVDPVVGEFPFRASGRALSIGQTDGFVRIVADASGTILGGQVVGPEASEMIAEIGLAVELEAKLKDVATMVHTHPTLSESVMEAAENALGRAIHTLNR